MWPKSEVERACGSTVIPHTKSEGVDMFIYIYQYSCI